jgi:hypothetical protein
MTAVGNTRTNTVTLATSVTGAQAPAPLLDNWIGGRFVSAVGRDTLDVRSPVDEHLVRRTPISSTGDVCAAVESAAENQRRWGALVTCF